jgi:competence protein ComEC
MSFGSFSAILTGDLEKAGESAVLSLTGEMDSRLIKVAHHGSRAGTSNQFLSRTKPRWAILSVGRNNPFSHPSSETVARLLHHRARPLSTIDEGAITLETDGHQFLLKSHRSGILDRGKL